MRKAYTLVELLVAIVILAILASILVPAFAGTKLLARSAACLSNLRQISLATTLYVVDWDTYPLLNFRFNEDPSLSNTGIRWFDMLAPYAKSKPVFACALTPDVPPGRNMTYGYNYQFLGNTHLRTGMERRLVADTSIPEPTKTLAVTDSAGVERSLVLAENRPYVPFFHGFVVDPPFSDWDSFSPPLDEDKGWCWLGHRCHVAPRHRGGLQVAFCDGHAARMTEARLMKDNAFWDGTGQP